MDERVPNVGFYTLMYGKERPGYLPAAQIRTNEMRRGSIRSSMPGCQSGYPIAIDGMISAFDRVSEFADTVYPPIGHMHRVRGVGA